MSRSPGFVGLGGMRCGSTWIARILEEHPDIYVPTALKEVHFFDAFYKDPKVREERRKWNYEKGIDWYESIFAQAKPNQIAGELTPNYLYDGEAAQLIKNHYPDIKLIVSLRDPVDRTISHMNYVNINQMGGNRQIDVSFLRQFNDSYGFTEFSHYSRHLTRFLELFDHSQILIIPYHQITECPNRVAQEIYSFLDVDPTFNPPSLTHKINTSSNKKFKFMFSILRKIRKSLKHHRRLIGFLKKAGLVSMFRKLTRLNAQDQSSKKTNPDLMAVLQMEFKEEKRWMNSLFKDV